jgi:hypothetical protein
VVVYEHSIWSFILRDENKLKVFKNRVLRKIFGPKRDKKAGEWRKLRKEELRDRMTKSWKM